MSRDDSSRLAAACALGTVGVIVACSVAAGAPSPLPPIALGAAWLLHVERVVIGAVGIAALVTLVVRMARGQLPMKLGASSLEFEPSSADRGIARDEILRADVEVLKRRI